MKRKVITMATKEQVIKDMDKIIGLIKTDSSEISA